MKVGFPETEDCQRCGGKGHYFVKLSEPERTKGGNIKWRPATGPHWCLVCGSTGQRKLRRRRQQGPRRVKFNEQGEVTWRSRT